MTTIYAAVNYCLDDIEFSEQFPLCFTQNKMNERVALQFVNFITDKMYSHWTLKILIERELQLFPWRLLNSYHLEMSLKSKNW